MAASAVSGEAENLNPSRERKRVVVGRREKTSRVARAPRSDFHRFAEFFAAVCSTNSCTFAMIRSSTDGANGPGSAV